MIYLEVGVDAFCSWWYTGVLYWYLHGICCESRLVAGLDGREYKVTLRPYSGPMITLTSRLLHGSAFAMYGNGT